MADVDDHGIGPRHLLGAAKKWATLFDRLLRRGKADAHGRAMSQRFQPFERQREMRAALVVGHGVDFVHDHGLDIAQDRAALSAVSRM